RESYRQVQGFVTADGARAFFAFAERSTVSEILALDAYDAETRRYLDTIMRAPEAAEAANPVLGDVADDETESAMSDSLQLIAEQPNTAELRALLEESQLLAKRESTPLLQDARRSIEPVLTTELRRQANENIDSFHARARELAYLANILRCV